MYIYIGKLCGGANFINQDIYCFRQNKNTFAIICGVSTIRITHITLNKSEIRICYVDRISKLLIVLMDIIL